MDMPPAEVHVWSMTLDVGNAQLAELNALLSEDEQRRAARFHFARDRDRWIAAHGKLRLILGRYLDTAPMAQRFGLGPFGKPYLADEALRFNLSHSDNQALVAVAKRSEVGVDIERRRSNFSPEELAAQVFSPQEQSAFRALPPQKQHKAFLDLWTAKEAYIKARGLGFSFPLTQLTIRPDPDSSVFWTEDASDDGTQPFLSLQRLNISDDFSAALAFEGPLTAIRLLA